MKLFNPFKKIAGYMASTKFSATTRLLVQGLGDVIWPKRNYENFANETYVKNIVAFRCIDEVSKGVSSVKWKLYKTGTDGKRVEVENHPVLDLFKRPSPTEGVTFFILKTIAYLLISGNAYIERVGPTTGPNKGLPKELYSLRPDRMRIRVDPSTGFIRGYEYQVGGNTHFFEADYVTGKSEILHLKLFHPTNDWYGMAVTEPAAREVDTSNQATEWNKKLLENEARPGMIVSIAGNLTQPQWDRLEKKLQEKYSGPSNVGKNLILEGNGLAKAEPYGFSPKEMEFIEGNREMSRKIAYAYGVPSMLVGIPGDNTYSNYKEARLAFWEGTIMYYLELLKSEMNNWIFGDDSKGLYLDYYLDDVPALAPKREELWNKAQTSNFITINEKRRMVGYEDHEGGDVLLVPANLIPVSEETYREIDSTIAKEEDDENRIIKRLISQGYTEGEAREMLGLPEKQK